MSDNKLKQQPLTVTGCHWWRFLDFTDSRGSLSVAELAKMPFEVRRVFFITDVPAGETRGNHAQRIANEIVFAPIGRVAVSVDDGKTKDQITLQGRTFGLFIQPKVWCSFSHFSADAVLTVFASHAYDPAGQISDYTEFLSVAAKEL